MNLIIGIMYVDDAKKVKKDLVDEFGSIKIETEPYDFTQFTKYYNREMGDKIFKKFFIFEKKIEKKDLVEIKKKITEIEGKYSKDKKRQINLDPGFINNEELTLASFKRGTNYKEDLGNGVYAHKVLEFKPLKIFWHTFPDYKKFKEKFLVISEGL